jgi:hypothetical protein
MESNDDDIDDTIIQSVQCDADLDGAKSDAADSDASVGSG